MEWKRKARAEGVLKGAREGTWERDIDGGSGTCLHWFLPFASKRQKWITRFKFCRCRYSTICL